MSDFVLSKTITLRGSSERVHERTLTSDDGRMATLPSTSSDDTGESLRASLKALIELAGEKSDGLTVEIDTAWSECECCGSSPMDTWRVRLDGEEVIEFFHDGHLGGGDDLFDLDDLFVRSAEALGHQVDLRRSGRIVIEIDGQSRHYDAEWDIERIGKNRDLTLELSLDSDRLPTFEYMESLLPNLPAVSRVTVGSERQEQFSRFLDSLGQDEAFASRVAELRSVLVIDGSADQARALALDVLAAYVAGSQEVQDVILQSCPCSTHFDLFRVALERGIAIPEDRLPHGLRLSAA